MLTEQRLCEVLQKVAPSAQVTVTRDGRQWVAVVVSPSFEGQDEGDRQSDVWGLILDNLEPYEQTQVEFIFTNTPDEQRADAVSP